MKTPLFLLIFFLSLSPVLWSQNLVSGIALDESPLHYWQNPAQLGFGRFQGLGLSFENSPDGAWEDTEGGLRVDSPFGSFGALGNREGYDLSWALGLNLIPKVLSLGYESRYQMRNQELHIHRWGAALRPLSFLSTALVYETSEVASELTLGAGIRPLAFSPQWAQRLLFWGDYDPWNQDILSLGAQFTPMEGLDLSGAYSPKEETWSFQFALKLMGSILNVSSNLDRSVLSSYTNFVPQENLSLPGQKKLLLMPSHAFIPESPSWGFLSQPPSLAQVLERIQALSLDPSIEGLVFINQPLFSSTTNRLALVESLMAFKAQGKKIYMHFDTIDFWGYALAASVADEISLAPLGMINIQSLALTRLYFQQLLEGLGIKFYNFHTGEYKSAGFPYSRNELGEEEKTSLREILTMMEGLFQELVFSGRENRLKGEVKEILKEGPYLYGAKALENGLVDRLGTARDFQDRLGEKTGLPIIPYREEKPFQGNWGLDFSPKIAVVYATGNILYGEGVAGSSVGSTTLVNTLDQLNKDPQVAGIVLRIDSPGGSALASDLIASKVRSIAQGSKPIVVSMGNVAASGGYYIAAQANHIIASPATLTGSIGVVFLLPDFSQLVKNIGIKAQSLGVDEDMTPWPNPFFSLSPKAEEVLQDSLEANYNQFLETVAQGRTMEVEEVRAIAQGRLWTGAQGLNNGLIDELGDLNEAIEKVKTLANLENHRLIELPGGRVQGLWEELLGSAFGTISPLPMGIQELLQEIQNFTDLPPGEALFLAPELF